MAMEDVVKKLEEEGDTVALERIKEEAEVSMDGATVGLAEQALARLNAISKKAEAVGVVPAEKIAQVESLGGSGDEIINRTREIDGKIDNLRAETEIKIKEIIKGQDGAEMPKLEAISISPERIEKLKAELAEARKFQKAKHAMSRWQDLYWAIKENQEVPHVMHVETWKGEDGPADDYKAEMERLENSEELAPWRENFKNEPGENGYWSNWANPVALDLEKSYVEFLKDSGLSEKYKVYNVMIPSELFDKIPQDLEQEISTLEQEKEKQGL